MSEKKLTPWFPPEVKPVRPGIYIASVTPLVNFYRRWDGKNWHYGDYKVTAAAKKARKVWDEGRAPIHWRGLAEQPK